MSKRQDQGKNVPANNKDNEKKILAALSKMESHSGPLPDPKTLAYYNEIIPNGGDRIMTLLEKQTSHRMELEKKEQENKFWLTKAAQNKAFVIAVVCLVCAAFCAYIGETTVATAIGTTTVVGLVGAFLYGKKQQQKQIEALNKDIESDS